MWDLSPLPVVANQLKSTETCSSLTQVCLGNLLQSTVDLHRSNPDLCCRSAPVCPTIPLCSVICTTLPIIIPYDLLLCPPNPAQDLPPAIYPTFLPVRSATVHYVICFRSAFSLTYNLPTICHSALCDLLPICLQSDLQSATPQSAALRSSSRLDRTKAEKLDLYLTVVLCIAGAVMTVDRWQHRYIS